jgi:hypothetical protein
VLRVGVRCFDRTCGFFGKAHGACRGRHKKGAALKTQPIYGAPKVMSATSQMRLSSALSSSSRNERQDAELQPQEQCQRLGDHTTFDGHHRSSLRRQFTPREGRLAF